MCLFQGVLNYFSNVTQNKSLQYCPLSKVILIQYLNVVYIFILSFIFLHEKIFFSDLLGACFIVGFMTYNSYYPLPTK
jgi:drug/metabolite transporter (DMT)-like permease